jgi:nicotinamide-nucleotide amidase
MDQQLFELAEQLGQLLKAQKKKIATAESCTGGWIAEVITEVPGSSVWFDRGFVTYSNAAKVQMLGVKTETLRRYGAVSAEVVREMAEGAMAQSEADCVCAVTGIAGPDGGTCDKPVGTVFMAWQWKSQDCNVIRRQFTGDRQQIRAQTVKVAIEGLLQSK